MTAATNVDVTERVDVEVELIAHLLLVQSGRPVDSSSFCRSPRVIKPAFDRRAMLRNEIRVGDGRRERRHRDWYATIIEKLIERRRLERAACREKNVGRRSCIRRQRKVERDSRAHRLMRFALGVAARSTTGHELVGYPVDAGAK